MPDTPSQHNPYKDAGVDDDTASSLVTWLSQKTTATATKTHPHNNQNPLHSKKPMGRVLTELGGFAAVMEPCFEGLKNPLLVTTTDGVGTKILLALEHNELDGIGQDLVAMCANDLFTIGAKCLGFLDYYASGKLCETSFKRILTSIHSALQSIHCPLLGGETAQLPGLYAKDHFDLAGFMLGVVDSEHVLGKHRLEDGDILYALPASGFHSNGYSLIRSWLRQDKKPCSFELAKTLLAPTCLYQEIPYLTNTLGTDVIHACAHITGGGITGNLSRILPETLDAHISYQALPLKSSIKTFIENYSQKSWQQFSGVFNLGCGMIVAVAKDRCETFEKAMQEIAKPQAKIGYITKTAKHHDHHDSKKIIYHE